MVEDLIICAVFTWIFKKRSFYFNSLSLLRLLLQLERRARQWHVDSRVGDLLHELATFLKDQEGKFHEKYKYFASHTLENLKKHQPKLFAYYAALKVCIKYVCMRICADMSLLKCACACMCMFFFGRLQLA